MPRRACVLLMMLFIAGCGDRAWRTKDISGLMPPLEFQLASAAGGTVSGADLRGTTVLLVFGYTSCPDVCPMTLARLAALKGQLPRDLAEGVQILFVSVDPRRDSPDRLASFVRHFAPEALAVTGSSEQLHVLARRYRTTFSYGSPNEEGFYPVAHPAGIYLFDAKGRARLLFRPGDSLEAMAADLSVLLHS